MLCNGAKLEFWYLFFKENKTFYRVSKKNLSLKYLPYMAFPAFLWVFSEFLIQLVRVIYILIPDVFVTPCKWYCFNAYSISIRPFVHSFISVILIMDINDGWPMNKYIHTNLVIALSNGQYCMKHCWYCL